MQNQFIFGAYIRILKNLIEHLNTLFYDVSFLNTVSIFHIEPYGGHLFNMLITFLYLKPLA